MLGWGEAAGEDRKSVSYWGKGAPGGGHSSVCVSVCVCVCVRECVCVCVRECVCVCVVVVV